MNVMKSCSKSRSVDCIDTHVSKTARRGAPPVEEMQRVQRPGHPPEERFEHPGSQGRCASGALKAKARLSKQAHWLRLRAFLRGPRVVLQPIEQRLELGRDGPLVDLY